MIYGYCRISTSKQNIERQERNIKAAYPNAVIVREAFTGTKVEGRKEFQRLIKKVAKGDTIVFDSVSRMSRDAESGFSLYVDFYNKGVELVFLKEQYVSTAIYRRAAEKQINAIISSGDAAADRMINGIIGLINEYALELARRQIQVAFAQAEKEVADLHQRTKEGIETARLHGKQIGLLPGTKLTVKKARRAKEIIRAHSRAFGGTLADHECMKIAGISKPTYYKYKRELAAEMTAEMDADE